MMKYVWILIFLCGCASIGTIDLEERKVTLDGWGAKSFLWEEEGIKASITRGEPIACPTTIPIIK